MRKFHSYGPVDERQHFTVPRKKLITSCMGNLIGDPEKGGHYFTIWAPRQSGKTWIMRQVKEKIEQHYAERFSVHCFSFGDLRGMRFDPTGGVEIPDALSDVLEIGLPGNPVVKTWKDFRFLFSKHKGLWKKPLILMIDEVDTAPSELIDLVVGRFREMYLDRQNNYLHGLALVGVRAVLGVESERGSPFNIQRSLHVENFTWEEVEDLFMQYQEEGGQKIVPEVIHQVFDATRGQPGLVCWFGELLTEKFNPGMDGVIRMDVWNDTFRRACTTEWNNTILNLIKKAKGKYCPHIIDLFTRSDIPFLIDADWCAYAYFHGIIDSQTIVDSEGYQMEFCRFSSPFIQRRLYTALTLDIIGDRLPILALEPTDRITDILNHPGLDLPGLLERYKAYLKRLKAEGLNPWKDQPRRADMRLRESVGHFHLYAWLQNAVSRYCVISPEFPTRNGKVDLHLKCGDNSGIIEVKSFTDFAAMERSRSQAAGYALKMGLKSVAVALFIPVEDEDVLDQFSGETIIDGVKVFVSAIGWV
jgi:hypothetical protein